MDIKNLLDQLLQSGKEMAQKGQSTVENQLNIPASGEQRAATLSTLKTGAAAAGILALLLGTKTGRGATGTALKVGSVAALGGLAYQMYQKWKNGEFGGSTAAASPVLISTPTGVETTRLEADVLLKVMIAAAKADGHVDQAELKTIREQLASYGLAAQLNDLILTEMTKPLSVADIAALANDDQAAAIEIYLVSKLVVGETNEAEKAYLIQLQQALGLPDAVVQGV